MTFQEYSFPRWLIKNTTLQWLSKNTTSQEDSSRIKRAVSLLQQSPYRNYVQGRTKLIFKIPHFKYNCHDLHWTGLTLFSISVRWLTASGLSEHVSDRDSVWHIADVDLLHELHVPLHTLSLSLRDWPCSRTRPTDYSALDLTHLGQQQHSGPHMLHRTDTHMYVTHGHS